MNKFFQIRGHSALCRVGIGLFLSLVNFSCAQLPPQAVTEPEAPAVALPPEDIGVDLSCSYFYYLWGKSAELDNRYDEALEAYEKLHLCDNGSVETIRNLAIVHVKMNRREEAVRWLGELVRKTPDDSDARLLLAGLYSSMGRTEEAVAEYEYLLARREDEQTMLMLASLYARDARFDKAREILDRIIARDADSYMGHYNLGRLLRQQRQFPEAVREYEKAMEINWSLPLAFEVAEFYEGVGRLGESAALYRRILEEDESSEAVRIRLVSVLLSAGETGKALDELWVLREYVSDPQRVDVSIARLLFTSEKYQEAASILSAVIDADPEQHEARLLLGHTHYRDGRIDKALKVFKAIPVQSLEYEESVLAQVRILWENNRRGQAVQLLRDRIAGKETRKKSFYVILASFLREENKVDRARQVFEQGLKEYPGNGEFLYEYAIFLEKIGDQAAALVKMEEVLALEPENSSALNYIGYTWADQGVNLDLALEYIQKAISLSPDDGYIRDSLGWVYFRRGDIDRALVELETSVGMIDDDPVIHDHLGQVYLVLERREDARRALEKALELYEEEAKKAQVRGKLETLDHER